MGGRVCLVMGGKLRWVGLITPVMSFQRWTANGGVRRRAPRHHSPPPVSGLPGSGRPVLGLAV